MRVRWVRESTSDLTRIRAYIAQDSERAAEYVRLRIVDAVKKLEGLPHLGRPGRREGTRQLVVAGLSYIIVYRLGDGELVILGIFHGSQSQRDF